MAAGEDPHAEGMVVLRRDALPFRRARLLVLSDTHIPHRARHLPDPVWQAAERCDAILHAGDVAEAWVLKALERCAPVLAVRGNVDDPELHALLPDVRVVEVGGVRLGLTHGHLGRGRGAAQQARSLLEGTGVQAVVFGHSHQPLLERGPDGVLLLNPGSPTDPRRAPRPSFAWVEVEEGELEAWHEYL